MLLAAKLYEQGKLSLRQAAENGWLQQKNLYGLLIRYNVPVFDYDPSKISNDTKKCRQLSYLTQVASFFWIKLTSFICYKKLTSD